MPNPLKTTVPYTSNPLQLLTIQDLARLFRVNTRTIRRWLVDKRIPPGIWINQRTRRWLAVEIQQTLFNLPQPADRAA